MQHLQIGLISEGKVPPDKRVAFTPLQVEEIMQRFPHVKVVCQKSEVRCFQDEEFAALGIELVDSVADCDILFGIKEVPIAQLIAGKIYLFFSHTIKKQPYNRKLLQAAIARNITLIDYEALKDKQGNRLVAFGRFAGIVGAYNALWVYGKKHKSFNLRRAFECFDINDLKLELRKIPSLPPLKIILTGSGRVAKGAMETLDTAGIRKVSPGEFLSLHFSEPVYVQLGSNEYHVPIQGGHFNRDEFHRHPERYKSTFYHFTQVADILIAGAYWNPKAPALFSSHDIHDSFKINIIADITCDLNGSIPTTIKASSIPEPIYDYDVNNHQVAPPFSHPNNITVMAVDNLPCELPRSASEEFGHDLIDRVLKPLFTRDIEGIVARGIVAEKGHLSKNFEYLTDYLEGR